jgi:hypothetical protein
MKKILTTILAFFVGLNLVFGQSADPAVTGANFIPNQINVEQTSVLTVSFANTAKGCKVVKSAVVSGHILAFVVASNMGAIGQL